jgi:hypothetical protein
MQEIRIETMDQLEDFVLKASSVEHIEKVVSRALKVCFINVGEPTLEQCKSKVINFIQKYCYLDAEFERPLFICFGWDSINFYDKPKES